MSANDFFDSYNEIPVWKNINGELVCVDAKTNKVICKKSRPTLKNGGAISFFTPYRAILVNDFQCYVTEIPAYINEKNIIKKQKKEILISKGEHVYVGMKPNGEFYLSYSDKRTSNIGPSIVISDFSFV